MVDSSNYTSSKFTMPELKFSRRKLLGSAALAGLAPAIATKAMADHHSKNAKATLKKKGDLLNLQINQVSSYFNLTEKVVKLIGKRIYSLISLRILRYFQVL